MRIAVDLDSTITATKTSIEFFKLLTAAFIKQNEIYNITNRQQGTELKIANELRMLNISYSHIVITSNKADYTTEED
jgi:phosphoserine phosphatase